MKFNIASVDEILFNQNIFKFVQQEMSKIHRSSPKMVIYYPMSISDPSFKIDPRKNVLLQKVFTTEFLEP
jgi:hypothetical protein